MEVERAREVNGKAGATSVVLKCQCFTHTSLPGPVFVQFKMIFEYHYKMKPKSLGPFYHILLKHCL